MTTYATQQPTHASTRNALWEIVSPQSRPSQPARISGTGAVGTHAVNEPIALYRTGFSSEAAMRILRTGISSRAITPLGQFLGIGKAELASILDLDRTTAQRRADKDLPLPTHSAESVLRVLELEAMVTDLFETEETAMNWLRRPHPMLEGDSPLAAAKTSYGTRCVKDILIAIKYGGAV